MHARTYTHTPLTHAHVHTHTHQDHPYVWLSLIEHLSFPLCVHCLAWLLGAERPGEVDHGLAQTNVADLTVEDLALRPVVQDLLVLLRWDELGEALPLASTLDILIFTCPSLGPSKGL